MRYVTLSIFLFLSLFSSPAMSETAEDWLNKAGAISDGSKYTAPFKAIEYLNNASKLQPENAEIYYNRGVAYDNLGQYQPAIKDYSQAIRLKPDYAEAFYNRGTIYNELAQYEQAISDFNQAIDLQPTDAEAYHNRGFAYDKLSQFEQAIENYNQAIRLKPDYASAYHNRGIVYFSRGNNNPGCSDAQRACSLGHCKLMEMAKKRGLCH
ncbi:MAG TPA: tetratricopeptide repeat protein [Smithella sp.]|nr:tetratricopeptide repeat protein [Smithella sp.]HNY50474.1 tetratricopeptide repeat protein [Smithella sp.]HOG90198.1 tetratricopeptide repeat protein [Smithella sp.]HQG65257.1 tetratricopeptide repeat protein [Smithella sp.]HQH16256.1 tetratricopeptide repeat protein [Smithella sp.]